MSEAVVCYFDGLCERDPATGRRNPGGIACGGWHVEPHPDVPGLEHGLSGYSVYSRGPGATNNVAEYRAAIDALRAIERTGWRSHVVICGDSQLVIRQASGSWACKSPTLAPLLADLRAATWAFARVQFDWVPREQNWRADALSRRAYEEALREEVAYGHHDERTAQ